MNLPQHLQHFPHPTLLIASDSVHAAFYLLGGDSMEELDGVSLPRENKQDSEGSFTSSDGSRVAGPDADIDDGPRLHHFIHAVVEQADALINEHGIAKIHLIMPAEIEHQFTHHLPEEISSKIDKTLHLDAMKESPIELVERLFA